MERQFNAEIESLKLGAGETFHGEGILAVTKALLQSGVSYVGGYQGAPVSHLLDVMVQARDYMAELVVAASYLQPDSAAVKGLVAVQQRMSDNAGRMSWRASSSIRRP